MPIYETTKDRRNQQGAFEELRPLLGIQHFSELPRLNIYDYKIWTGTKWFKPKKERTKAQCEKAYLEIKCYNSWLGQHNGNKGSRTPAVASSSIGPRDVTFKGEGSTTPAVASSSIGPRDVTFQKRRSR